MMIDAMSEWQNDWATYMPTKELKKVDILIMHGSYAVPVHELNDTIIRRQRYYTGINRRLPEKFFSTGIYRAMENSFIYNKTRNRTAPGEIPMEIFDIM